MVCALSGDQGPGACLGWDRCQAQTREVRKRAVCCRSLSAPLHTWKTSATCFGDEAPSGNESDSSPSPSTNRGFSVAQARFHHRMSPVLSPRGSPARPVPLACAGHVPLWASRHPEAPFPLLRGVNQPAVKPVFHNRFQWFHSLSSERKKFKRNGGV